MLLCIDVGNTFIKFALFSRDILIRRERFSSIPYDDTEEMRKFISNYCVSIERVVISCNIPIWKLFMQNMIVEITGVLPCFINVDLIMPIKISKNRSNIGADFIAFSSAAVTLFPNRNIIIVSAGTAITCTAISDDGYILYTLISSGLGKITNSLFQIPNLRKIVPDFNISDIRELNIQNDEYSTFNAISGGLYCAIRGTCKEMVNFMKDNVFKEVSDCMIIGCGGDINVIGDIVDYSEEFLVIDGLNILSRLNNVCNKVV